MIIIVHFVLVLLAQSLVHASSRTISVEEGNKALLEWDISKYTKAEKFEIYYNKDTNLATIQQSGSTQVTDAGTNKYGKRLQVGKIGNRIRMTITKFTGSDKGTYEVDVVLGRNKNQPLQKLILELEDSPSSSYLGSGISSSTGIIIGVVVGIVVIAILIALCCYCYKKRRDSDGDDDGESGTRLAAFNTGR